MRAADWLKETKNYLLLITVAAFGAGFVDLVRGGITVSAILLAIAYCILVPLVIWHRTSGGETGNAEGERPSYPAAGIVSACVLGLYLLTLAPSTAMWDTSEYIAAAYTFGLPHPPGNPLFVIVGRAFSLLPVAPSVASRINVLAAIASAVAAGCWFLITEHVLRGWLRSRALRIVGATAGALIGALAFTVWNQSVVNEKVYTVSLAGIAIVSWLAVRWTRDPEGPFGDRRLVLAAYLCGLGYANHMAGMLPVGALGVAILAIRPRTLLRGRLMFACAGAALLGLSPFATQPIRAAYFPAVNEGEPTGCRTKLELSCTLSKATLDSFLYNFNRGQYAKPSLENRQASLGEQVGMWWLYFKWQWMRDADESWPLTQSLLAATFLVLGLAGARAHAARDRPSFWYFSALMFTMTLLLVYYLNFKLGSSQNPTSPQDHEVRDRDYFFIWSFSAWGVWAALGLVYVWESLAALVGTRDAKKGKPSEAEPTGWGWVLTSPAMALALVPLATNWSAAPRSHHQATRNVAADMLNSVEPYGVLVTVGDNDTFPLWYAQEVEGIRRDVVVANTSLLNTEWYARQIIRRPIYDYDAARGPAIYRDKVWHKPTAPPLHMTFADADSYPEYIQLPGAMVFNSGALHATIDPRRLENGVLMRADALVLRMIQDSWPDRPIYFARSAGGYPRSLGLGDNVLTQGLASKLFVPPTAQTRDTVYIEGDAWLDVARSRALWNDVFTGPRAIASEGRWVDRPSVSMPALYLFGGVELSEALRAEGDSRGASAVLATTRDVARATRLDDVVRGVEQAMRRPETADSAGVTLAPAGETRLKTQSAEPIKPRRR
ncbi:MAG TPA: DUF2723 domain-containing protein [Gemmatimonadaceae bacterium]|nr:DUF2723 domain-containing protein [Gemmatimonadaceae bacterium]